MMPSKNRSRLNDVYDTLVSKKIELGDDPELDELYEEANRHFLAALNYQRRDVLEVNTNYELEQVIEALEAFEEVKDRDKGI